MKSFSREQIGESSLTTVISAAKDKKGDLFFPHKAVCEPSLTKETEFFFNEIVFSRKIRESLLTKVVFVPRKKIRESLLTKLLLF